MNPDILKTGIIRNIQNGKNIREIRENRMASIMIKEAIRTVNYASFFKSYVTIGMTK